MSKDKIELGMYEEVRYALIPETYSHCKNISSAYGLFTGKWSKGEDTYIPGSTHKEWFNTHMPQPKMWKSLKTLMNAYPKVYEKGGYILWFTVVVIACNTRTGIIRLLDSKYGKIIDGNLEIVDNDKIV